MKVIAITGQTATGKTRLALDLAKKVNGELVNFDSRQIYKHLDIITGKEFAVKHSRKIWLYDIIDPKNFYSSYDYVRRALPVIKKLLVKNKMPILVGGTYFYLKHLLYDIPTQQIPPNWNLRKKLANKTVKELQEILKKISPQLINQLNQSEINNSQRLIRKIEIAKSVLINQLINTKSNKKIILDEKLNSNPLSIQIIGLKFKNKEKLISTIKKRVEERIKNGAIEEVESLLKKGYTENDPGLKTIGYQQIIAYLKGELTREQAIEQWVNKEIQYAKRQYTFMKKDKNISWREV